MCGAAFDLRFPHWLLLLHLGALSCLVWLGQVRGWGQEAVGHGHSLQPGLIWHKQDGLALHRALLSASMGSLSSAGNSHPPVCGRWGEREGSCPGPEPWLALQAAPCCPVSAKPSLCPGPYT